MKLQDPEAGSGSWKEVLEKCSPSSELDAFHVQSVKDVRIFVVTSNCLLNNFFCLLIEFCRLYILFTFDYEKQMLVLFGFLPEE